MHDLLFPARPPALVAVRGRVERFPIRRIFCVGRNYAAHVREMGGSADRDTPVFFTKTVDHYLPSSQTMAYPPGTSNCQPEMELVAAIGTEAFRVAKAQALDHVFGYACGLDMTRRDLQTAAKDQRGPWDLAKDFEGAAVLSEIAPADDIGHPRAGRIELRVNGETRQASDLSLLIHDVAAIVAHLSHYYHLQPGDLIYTGTPEGVGPVAAGDRLDGSIEHVGAIALTIGPPE